MSFRFTAIAKSNCDSGVVVVVSGGGLISTTTTTNNFYGSSRNKGFIEIGGKFERSFINYE